MNKAFPGELRVGVKAIALVSVIGLLVLSCGCVGKDDSGASRPSPLWPEGVKARVAGGCMFSSDLRLRVFVVGQDGWYRWIGKTPSDRPIYIPPGRLWGIWPSWTYDMNAVAREIVAKRVPGLRIYRGTMVRDDDLAHIKGLTGLRELSLEGATKITDAGLVHLKGLTGLGWLNLHATKVTDAGLSHLKGLTGLQRLWLSRTNITDAGLAELRQALPKTKIDR